MSILLELHKIRKQNPNNNDFAEAMDKYLKEHRTCCSKPENLVDYVDNGSTAHGWLVTGVKCLKCGKLQIDKIDKS